MKKFILGGLAAAAVITPIALTAGSASAAGVERQCEEVVTGTTPVTVVTAAKFTAVQPANAYNQWDNLWKHDYTVTVQPNGSFEGLGVQNGHDSNGPLVDAPEAIVGQFTDSADADAVFDHVTYTATRTSDQVAYKVTNAPMGTGNSVVAEITVNGQPYVTPQPVEFKVSAGSFTSTTTTVDVLTEYANHGAYVAAMGGGKDVAQSCVGMPIKSNKNK